MPYFRKTSAMGEGWTGQDSLGKSDTLNSQHSNTPQRNTPNWSEHKLIPLKLCYLCRNHTMPDSQNRIIELHSPDGKNSCILRCPDEHIALQWFNAIHANVHIMTQHTLAEANHILANTPASSTGEIKHMGWLAEQVNPCSIVYRYSLTGQFRCGAFCAHIMTPIVIRDPLFYIKYWCSSWPCKFVR